MITPFTDLLKRMRTLPNHISPAAYDTAWVAWLYPEALEWLLDAQRPDGSWGAELEYYCDRVVSTLAAINAIAAVSTNGHHLKRVEAGIQYLEKAIPHLGQDVFETVGFELLLPNLVDIARSLGLKVERIKTLIEPLRPLYLKKLSLIPNQVIYSPRVVVAHSLEFLNFDTLDHAAVANLRSINGSIHNSPSATAFVEVAGGGSTEGRAYLERVVNRYNGAAPGFTPLELFEIIWILHHLSLNVNLNSLRPDVEPFVHLVASVWKERGVGFSTTFVPDPDDTSLALRLFGKLGVYWDPGVLELYEKEDHFQCFPLERDISLDVHIHIVHALKTVPHFPRRDDMLLKALNTLGRYLTTDYIVDKWHVSPYYSTSHAVIGLIGLADTIIAPQIGWLLKTQRDDGSWTFYPACPNAAVEETAYVLMALMTVYEKRGDIPFTAIERGFRYLVDHYTRAEDLPALWIHKGLYNPYRIVEAVILSTIAKFQTLSRRPPATSFLPPHKKHPLAPQAGVVRRQSGPAVSVDPNSPPRTPPQEGED
ncbi:MAG: prenyltransferase/squalene oxidase repeat-containing protein [Anaerolineae bacterium]